METKIRPREGSTGKKRPILLLVAIILAAAAVWIIVAVLSGGMNANQGAEAPQDGADPNAAAVGIADEESFVEPVTGFEETKPDDWPEGETIGCEYVVARLALVQESLEADGLNGMRQWLDAIDDLQGDPAMEELSTDFETVKREWSTVLAQAETEENADMEQLLAQGTQSLKDLQDKAQCE